MLTAGCAAVIPTAVTAAGPDSHRPGGRCGNGYTGKSYVIQSSASLQGFRDTADPPIAGTGGVLTKALPIGALTGSFYRIRVLP